MYYQYNTVDGSVGRSEITRALQRWSDVTPLTFRETSGEADITISFEVRNHGDGSSNSFDGRGNLFIYILLGWSQIKLECLNIVDEFTLYLFIYLFINLILCLFQRALSFAETLNKLNGYK